MNSSGRVWQGGGEGSGHRADFTFPPPTGPSLLSEHLKRATGDLFLSMAHATQTQVPINTTQNHPINTKVLPRGSPPRSHVYFHPRRVPCEPVRLSWQDNATGITGGSFVVGKCLILLTLFFT